MNLETKITIYKFTPQLFTLTQANTQTPGGEPMTTAPAFTRDGNCVTADARNNTPAGTATITDWQVQEVVNITIK